GLFAVEVLVGALNVFTRLHSAVVTTHLGLSALIWSCLVALVAVTWRAPARSEFVQRPVGAAAARPREKVLAYLALTKPRIIELLLVTTVPTMVVAKRGVPSGWLVLATVLGGTLAAGGANALNMYIDRDIDRRMERTKGRPLATGALQPPNALLYARL